MKRKIPSRPFPGKAKKTRDAKPNAPQTVDTVVTFLEMHENPHHHEHPPANLKVALIHAEQPTVHFYRYLYDTVGGNYAWVDRKRLSDDELASEINNENVDVFVAYVDGTPAGYYEIGRRSPEETWLEYFGIIPDFHGRGLGKWLLAEAITSAWSTGPDVVRVETCTLDDPRALPLYQRMGFVPYERKEKSMELMPD